MKIQFIAILIACSLCIAAVPAHAAEGPAGKPALELSPELMELLREEMRAILSGVQAMPAAIAMADWPKIADIGSRISASYILAQKLTPEQRHELHHSLPGYFKRLDADFHAEARKLETAATQHDSQLVAFHYYRLVESCTACHAVYATERFPGFSPATDAGHHH